MSEPFSDRSMDLAARMLRVVLEEPNERERIDALAALCNAALGLRKDRPKAWRRLTTHDCFGAALSATSEPT
jgi:hypothetical protein